METARRAQRLSVAKELFVHLLRTPGVPSDVAAELTDDVARCDEALRSLGIGPGTGADALSHDEGGVGPSPRGSESQSNPMGRADAVSAADSAPLSPDERGDFLGAKQAVLGRLPEGHPPFVGESDAILRVFDAIDKTAVTDAAVLVSGDTGTGKELVAAMIHYNSRRAKRKFLRVNCAALPSTMLESELFGHEKGAFTGAAGRHPGIFEQADGGTVFLDEISAMDLPTQQRFLRVIERHPFRRLGGTEDIASNVRIIAATNQDLQTAVDTGRFREDLLHRLYVMVVSLPALKARCEDIALLAEYFVRECAAEHDTPAKTLSVEAISLLLELDWPGNVRQLGNTVRRAMVLAGASSKLSRAAIERALPAPAASTSAPPTPSPCAQELNQELLILHLARRHGEIKIGKCISELGLSRSTALRLLNRLRSRGQLRRTGRGAATRYSPPGGAASRA